MSTGEHIIAPDAKVEHEDRLVAIPYTGDRTVAALFETPRSGVHLSRRSVEVVAGKGFVGDHAKKSYWRGAYIPGRDVSACASEVLEALQVDPEVVGDNLITRGIDLRVLVEGQQVQIGTVVLERSARDHRPCTTFRDRTSEETFRVAAQGFRGALFIVKQGGRIAVGDQIEVLPAPMARRIHRQGADATP